MGQIGILNVGAGDTKLSFNPDDPAECIRAARIVADMLKRGYALLIDTGVKDKNGKPIYRRAKAFDENTCEYIIADFDPTVGVEEPDESPAKTTPRAPIEKVRRGRVTIKRIPASATNAVAVARSAGG